MKIEGETGRYDACRLEKEISRNIDYFSMEYRLTYIEVIGVLEVIKIKLLSEAMGRE